MKKSLKKSLVLEEGSPSRKKSRMESNGSEGEISGTIHPLLIDHVLENVFGHLMDKAKPKDLLGCRLVCKDWYNIGTEMYQRLEADRVVRFAFGDTSRMTRFLEAMKNTTSLPFQKYKFDVNFFIEENEELFPEFMDTCSPFITNLSLCFGKNFKMSFDPAKFQNVDLRSLKSFSFNCTYLNTMMTSGSRTMWNSEHPPVQQYDGILKLIALIMESAPDLHELDFCIPTDHLGHAELVEFGNLLTKSIPAKVKILKLILEINEEQLKTLKMRGLKLETLHINFFGSLLKTECIQTFLHSQKGTLKTLNIADLEKQFAEQLDYSTFSNLKVLEIKGGNNSSFAYLKSFPSLEKVVLRNGRNGDTVSMQNAELRFPSVKEVELTYEAPIYNLVGQFGRIFPNLKTFRLRIGADSLPALSMVFELMPGLEELQIAFPHFFENLAVDTVLTGIPIETCRKMLEMRSFTVSDVGAISRKPNISSLTKLKKLSIKAESYAIVVTNVTAVFGLLQSQSLEELEMEQFNISRDYYQRLKDRFGVKLCAVKKESEFVGDARYFLPSSRISLPVPEIRLDRL